MNLLSPATVAFLKALGGEAAVRDPDSWSEEELIALLRASCPDPLEFNEEGRACLAAVTDSLGVLSEMLYHNYRQAVDLFRHIVFSLRSSAIPEDPVWKEALQTGDRLGLLNPEDICLRPHINETVRRAIE